MHYLITGGCGFIGSHLAEALLKSGHRVTVLDDLSTGRLDNIAGFQSRPDLNIEIGSVTDDEIVERVVSQCDAIFHLASAVGVKLIMERPIQSIDTMVRGTQTILRLAKQYQCPTLVASTSEVYGKSKDVPFDEDGDRLEGPTTKHRWAYACAKALDEFLAIAYWRTESLPVIVVRLFNTVGPRQTGQYGMVIPNFVQRALAGLPIQVFGEGTQTRCFCHVDDVVRGLQQLMSCSEAYGQVFNLGSTSEITVLGLAEKIIDQLKSPSRIERLAYTEVFGEGFEDMQRRVPKIDKIRNLIGWTPEKDLTCIIDDVAKSFSSPSDQRPVDESHG